MNGRRVRAAAAAVAVAALLAACGGPGPAGGQVVAPSSSASAGVSGNPALALALTADMLSEEVPGLEQTSDTVLAGARDSDARVFTRSDSGAAVEIDLVVDVDSAAAAARYATMSSSAARQVNRPAASSAPALGTQAVEYRGVNSDARALVSIAFQQAAVVCVVTMVARTGGVDSAVVEAIARAQERRILAAAT